MVVPQQDLHRDTRLQLLAEYDIAGADAEPGFDDIARLAASTTAMPIAFVSFLGETTQWLTARIGIDTASAPIEHSICVHTIQQDDVFVVEDLRSDPRFVSNPYVTEPSGMRFYAGAPILGRGGVPLGTVCVLDTAPHQFDDRQRDYLRSLANLASTLLESRKRNLTLRTQSTRLEQALAEAEKARAALAEEEKYIHQISTQVPGLIYQFQLFPDGRSCFPWASHAIEAIYRVTPESVLHDATPVFDVLHPDDFDRVRESITQSAAKLTRWECEYRVRFQDGTVHWRHGSAVPERQPDGSVIWSGYIGDITERKRDEASRMLAFETLQALYELEDGILNNRPFEVIGHRALDAARRLMRAERVALVRIDADTREGRVVLVSTEVPTRVQPGWQLNAEEVTTLLGGREIDQIELDQIKPQLRPGSELAILYDEGVRRMLKINVNVQGGAFGVLKICGGAGTGFSDEQARIGLEFAQHLAVASLHAEMSERIRNEAVRLEAEVRRRTAELESVNEELSAFSAMAAHDLRGPLAVIDGFSRALLLRLDPKLDSESRGFLDRIRNRTAQMAALIEKLLSLSRTMREALRIETVDLSALAREAAHSVRHRHDGHPVDCTVQDGILVRGDRVLLGIAMENLLDNAWKYSAKQASPRVVVSAHRDETAGEIVVSVRDNGVGFVMTDTSHLFEPFQRLHNATDFPGTGVGLSTVKRIMLRHHGRIWARSIPGQGAEFFLALPAT